MTEHEWAEALCIERCAQAGDPPCSRVCDDGHCDECIGMAKVVKERIAALEAGIAERDKAIGALIRSKVWAPCSISTEPRLVAHVYADELEALRLTDTGEKP